MRKLAPALTLAASMALALLMQGSAAAKEGAPPSAALPLPFGVNVECDIFFDEHGGPGNTAALFFVDHQVFDALFKVLCHARTMRCNVVEVGLTAVRKGDPLQGKLVAGYEWPATKWTGTYLALGTGDLGIDYDLPKGQVTVRSGRNMASYPCSGVTRQTLLTRMGAKPQ